jgi:translation elongation factor EF-4
VPTDRGPQPVGHAVEIDEVEEPYIKASVIVPKEYVGVVMEFATTAAQV